LACNALELQVELTSAAAEMAGNQQHSLLFSLLPGNPRIKAFVDRLILFFHRVLPSSPNEPLTKRSTERILTTHAGSLPRPADLLAVGEARQDDKPVDTAAYEARLAQAVGDGIASKELFS
jgi:hypothetical protein